LTAGTAGVRFHGGMAESVYPGGDEMAKPTSDQAQLVVELAKLNVQAGLPATMNWLWSDEFPPDYDEFVKKWPRGTSEYAKVGEILNFYETIGALWKHGLLSEELLFDWLWIGGPWERVKGHALARRQRSNNERLYELFEAMAEAEKRVEAKVPVGAGSR
jgi:hypothetical protein